MASTANCIICYSVCHWRCMHSRCALASGTHCLVEAGSEWQHSQKTGEALGGKSRVHILSDLLDETLSRVLLAGRKFDHHNLTGRLDPGLSSNQTIVGTQHSEEKRLSYRLGVVCGSSSARTLGHSRSSPAFLVSKTAKMRTHKHTSCLETPLNSCEFYTSGDGGGSRMI